MISDTIVLMADIHSNYEALNAVLKTINKENMDQLICLGDVVGYGPEPEACIDRLESLEAFVVAGNHDAAACGELSTDLFNRLARKSAHWTRKQLSEEYLEFLKNLPHKVKIEDFYGVHGSPEDPLLEYLMNSFQAKSSTEAIDESILGVGHTHKPVCFRETNQKQFKTITVQGEKQINWDPGSSENLVINPGSVGQPRDSDPRASYAILNPDREKIYWKRVSYPIETVQQKIHQANLPPDLAHRLQRGQ